MIDERVVAFLYGKRTGTADDVFQDNIGKKRADKECPEDGVGSRCVDFGKEQNGCN